MIWLSLNPSDRGPLSHPFAFILLLLIVLFLWGPPEHLAGVLHQLSFVTHHRLLLILLLSRHLMTCCLLPDLLLLTVATPNHCLLLLQLSRHVLLPPLRLLISTGSLCLAFERTGSPLLLLLD